jgi:hypothetical protein
MSHKQKRATGIQGDPLADIPNWVITQWAAEAGYTSCDDVERFRKYLDTQLVFYRSYTEIPPASQQRKELRPVVRAARLLQSALENLDEYLHDMLTTDREWPHHRGTGRIRVRDLIEIARGTASAAERLKKSPKNQMPGQPYERGSGRSRHIEHMACALVNAYWRRRGEFVLSAADAGYGTGYRFYSAAHTWLANILNATIPDISINEIDDAAEFARAHHNDAADLLAAEDALARAAGHTQS